MIAKRFEDLIFWQKSRELTKLVYAATRKPEFRKDPGLKEQIQRSCVSVMSNVAEGFGRGGNSEFIQFLFVAKGSLSEVKSQLYVGLDLNYIASSEFNKAYEMTEEISRLINSFIKSLKNAARKGLKTD
jgi:four helix bundle protein